jgi:hypothetical protein
MNVFQEAKIGDELYYIVGVTSNIPIFKKIKKISPTEYQEYLNMKREYASESKNIDEFPQGYVLTKTNPASRNKGGKRTNRRIKKNNKSRKGKSIKNRRK